MQREINNPSMQQSSNGTWNLAWKGMKRNKPCLGRLHGSC
uniref:Uncharacterized protein n=1 Tax=Arundo donax TaxID=35708 RepID=A0A0A8ZVY8_ARUDO